MPGFLAPGQVITMATPNKNYELKKNTYLISRYLAQQFKIYGAKKISFIQLILIFGACAHLAPPPPPTHHQLIHWLLE
jgi:hypothetical protein